MKKSKIELECEKWEEEYEKAFGEPYPWRVEDDEPFEYHVGRMKEALETDTPVEPDYIPPGWDA